MKKYLIFILSIFVSTASYAQASCSEELMEFGKSVFKSFQNEDFSIYKKYQMTEQDVDTLIKYYKEHLNYTFEGEIEETKINVRSISRLTENWFNNVIAQGKIEGIDWKKTELVYFMCGIRHLDTAPCGDLTLICESNDVTFLIELEIIINKNQSGLLFGQPILITEKVLR
jgi:hypothetical protein